MTTDRPWKELTEPERIRRLIDSPESKAAREAFAGPIDKAQVRRALGDKFQALVNAIEDANLVLGGLQAIELIVFAKQKIWEEIGE